MPGELPSRPNLELNPPVGPATGIGEIRPLTLPFGVVGDLFMPLPLDAAVSGSIYPTVTDKNDRKGDRE